PGARPGGAARVRRASRGAHAHGRGAVPPGRRRGARGRDAGRRARSGGARGAVRAGRPRRRGRAGGRRAQAARRRGGRVTGTVATVGTFDGVHRGHQAVLAEVVRRARAGGRPGVLVTFDPHPLEVVNPSAAPRLLTLPDEKRALVAALGIDRIEFLAFTPELARLAPEEFVRTVLRARYGMQELVLGYDDGFGRGR